MSNNTTSTGKSNTLGFKKQQRLSFKITTPSPICVMEWCVTEWYSHTYFMIWCNHTCTLLLSYT